MKVSILIPCHRTKFLMPLLESIRKQSFKDFEVIVLDSSFDKNEKLNLLKHFKDLNLKYFFVDNPVSKKRNYGVRVSKGEYIVFLDDDTIVGPNWLKELVENVEDRAIVGGVQTWWQFGETEIVPTCNCILPKKIAKEVKFDENWKYAAYEDKDWCFRAKKKGYKIILKPIAPIHHAPHKRLKLVKKEFLMGMEAAKFQKKWGRLSKFKLWKNFGSRCFVLIGDLAHLAGVIYGVVKYYILRRK